MAKGVKQSELASIVYSRVITRGPSLRSRERQGVQECD